MSLYTHLSVCLLVSLFHGTYIRQVPTVLSVVETESILTLRVDSRTFPLPTNFALGLRTH